MMGYQVEGQRYVDKPLTFLKENADQEVNVSEKTDICTQTILVQT